jgi:hypothetical protein
MMRGEGIVMQSSDNDDVRLQKLLAWAHSRHIWIHDDIEIRQMGSPMSSNVNGDKENDSPGSNNSPLDSVSKPLSPNEPVFDSGLGVYVKEGETILERQVGE